VHACTETIAGLLTRVRADDGPACASSPGCSRGRPLFALFAAGIPIAEMPSGLGKRDPFAVALLGGVGFTVSLLLADLALDGTDMEVAKGAALVASTVAVLVAAGLLIRGGRAHEEAEELAE
jgi:Na+/H+ antiporter NhaA